MAAAAIANGAVALPEADGEAGLGCGRHVRHCDSNGDGGRDGIRHCCGGLLRRGGQVRLTYRQRRCRRTMILPADFPALDFEAAGLFGKRRECWRWCCYSRWWAGAAGAFWLPQSRLAGGALLAGGRLAAPFCDPPLFAAAGAFLRAACQAGLRWCRGRAELLALLAASSSSVPKISFPECWSWTD